MKIDVINVGFLNENCYVLTINDKVLVIDPGDDFDNIDNIDWSSIQMTPPSYNNKEVISGRYQINIIDHTSGNAPLGKIWKKSVSI